MKLTLEELQEALVCEMITINQFVQVLVENLGAKKARKLIRKNMKLALDEYANKNPHEDLSTQKTLIDDPKFLHLLINEKLP